MLGTIIVGIHKFLDVINTDMSYIEPLNKGYLGFLTLMITVNCTCMYHRPMQLEVHAVSMCGTCIESDVSRL